MKENLTCLQDINCIKLQSSLKQTINYVNILLLAVYFQVKLHQQKKDKVSIMFCSYCTHTYLQHVTALSMRILAVSATNLTKRLFLSNPPGVYFISKINIHYYVSYKSTVFLFSLCLPTTTLC